MKRRTLLKSLPFAGAAVALPTAASPITPEGPWVKADRLAQELVEALSQIEGGRWSVEIFGDGRAMDVVFRNAAAQIDAERQLRQSASAIRHSMQHLAPGQEYMVCIAKGPNTAFAMSFHADGTKDRKIELGALND